jgi:hypothetical protein
MMKPLHIHMFFIVVHHTQGNYICYGYFR